MAVFRYALAEAGEARPGLAGVSSRGAAGALLAAGILLLTLLPQYFTWSPDDIYIATLHNPDAYAVQTFMFASRPLGAATFRLADMLGLDIIRDYDLLAVLYALAFGWFLVLALSRLCGRLPHPLLVATAAAIVGCYGFQIDFNQFKHQYVAAALMYALMALYLQADMRVSRRSLRLGLMIALGFAANLTYQASTMALALIALGRMLIAVTASDRLADVKAADRTRLADNAIAIVVACIAYFVFTKILFALGVPTWKPPAQVSLPWLMRRSAEYARALGALLTPLGGSYGAQTDLVGVFWGVLAGALVIPALLRRDVRRCLAVLLLLVGLLIALAQNPENIFLPTYWPAPRSSFYGGFVTLVLLLSASGALRRAGRVEMAIRRLAPMLAAVAILVELSAMAHLFIDHIAVYRNDLALARQIGALIRSRPDLAGASQIRFPAGSWRPRAQYFLGLEGPSYDYGSLFASQWAAAALVQMATGLQLAPSGTSTCPNQARNVDSLQLHREGKAIALCF